eukprot:11175208-Lingulodinium_polyedra.AAC.1
MADLACNDAEVPNAATICPSGHCVTTRCPCSSQPAITTWAEHAAPPQQQTTNWRANEAVIATRESTS